MIMIFALAWAQVRTYPARLLAIIAAVLLATGFLAATATFAATSGEGLRLTAAAPLTTADIVLDAESSVRDPGWYRAVADVPGVRTVDPQFARTVNVFGGDRRGSANVQSIAATPEIRWFHLDHGSWPNGTGQVVADQRTLDDLGVSVGGQLTFRQGDKQPVTVTVTGSTDLGFRPLTGSSFRFYADPSFFAGDVPPAALATVDDPDHLAATIDAVDRALPPGASAMSAAAAADQAAARFAGGNTQLVVLMMAFAAVALLASVLVIANTFHVVIVQRVRQIALLRLVGGHRGQASRVLLAEATIAGAVGATAGAAAGVAVGYLGADLLDISGGGLRVNPLALVGSVLVGVLATLAAAWFPARRATRVPPVRALQEAAEPPAGAVRGGRRLVVGAVVTVVAAAVLAVAGIGASLPLALVGGLLLAVGLLIALPRLIAVLLPSVTWLLERFGVAAGLAGSSLSQNARRTAAAAMAVVVGSALIACLAVAATTGRATIDADLEARYPVAVSARTDGGPISGDTVRRLAAVPELSVASTVATVDARFSDGGKATPAQLAALPTALAGTLAPELAASAGPPTVLLPAAYLAARGLSDGSPVSVGVGNRTLQFIAHASRLADTTGQLLGVTSADALTAQGVAAVPTTVWAVARPGFDRALLADRVNAVAASDPAVELGGGITEGSDIADVLAILLGLSLAMLGVTVIIALLGIANLLGLSVIERTQEMALLRALGTRRGRLRAMLAIEAVTITLVGAAAGVVIGVPVGLVGVTATVGATATPVIRLPWGQLGLLLLAAVVTGVLASVAPARRATRISPAQGLTH
ncbi:FtsX-like permease family protein [Micromonospora sp. C31]|uniref:FtsX-like permease family protein n=1 Tax=Micromonospora sp. C31 TaxID=2824876 RepID=UPI001B38AE72|nr:FtsX-like permease family protein [Micromonospora sp. C31]MBQ1075824.1 FtsX-like permease family protein [Micromonospora sp. C31]